MELQNTQSSMWSKSSLAIACGLLLAVGCDMGLDQSSNPYEQLDIETRKLLDVLTQISDEASANAHQTELEDAAEKVRHVQKGIAEMAQANAKKGGGGLSAITSYRQATLFQQTGDAARRQVERIREKDAKAGAIVDKAVEGIEFPTSAMGNSSPLGY